MPADFFLRPLDPAADGAALHAIFGDEDSCRYTANPAMPTVARTIALLDTWRTRHPDFTWTIVDSASKAALGCISLHPRGRNNTWDVACMITPAARGRNLAARALAVALDDIFANHNARRIVADIDPDNTASIRTFEKLGFIREARLRAEWEVHIGIRDTLIYGLLREDPRPWRNWPS